MKSTHYHLFRFLVAAHLGLGLQCLTAADAVAQPDGSTITQDRRDSSQQNRDAVTRQSSSKEAPAIAQVGAGTTSGSTTGYSGPKQNKSEATPRIALPELPNPQLCDDYKDTPAYQSCLSVTLRQ